LAGEEVKKGMLFYPPVGFLDGVAGLRLLAQLDVAAEDAMVRKVAGGMVYLPDVLVEVQAQARRNRRKIERSVVRTTCCAVTIGKPAFL